MVNQYSAQPVLTDTNLPMPTFPQIPNAPGAVATPAAVPVAPPGPTFADVIARLNSPTTINTNQPLQGGSYTDRAVNELAPSTGLRPEIQNVLDLINKNTNDARMKGIAEATSLASKRGLTGSSVEQFGTQQAAGQAEKAGRDAQANILLANAQREQTLQDSRAKILADRGNLEAQLGAQVGTDQAKLITEKLLQGAQLTSDEVASLRNTDFANKNLGLQMLLGQQGLDIARENIGASRDIASANARNNLLATGISSFAPSLVSSLFGGGGGGGGAGAGGGGFLANLFGGGGGGEAAGTLGGVGTGSTAASSLFPGGLGAVGTGATSGGMGLIPGLGLAGLGIAGYQALPDKGLLSKSTIAPLVNPLQTAKTVGSAVSGAVSSVGKSVSKVFRF